MIDWGNQLPNALYSKRDDRSDSKAEINTEHDAGAESSVKSGDGVRPEQKVKARDLIQKTQKVRKPQRRRKKRHATSNCKVSDSPVR